MRHTPVAIFAIGALLTTGALAWIVKCALDLSRALKLPQPPQGTPK